jgi:hypothetical protein
MGRLERFAERATSNVALLTLTIIALAVLAITL